MKESKTREIKSRKTKKHYGGCYNELRQTERINTEDLWHL